GHHAAVPGRFGFKSRIFVRVVQVLELLQEQRRPIDDLVAPKPKPYLVCAPGWFTSSYRTQRLPGDINQGTMFFSPCPFVGNQIMRQLLGLAAVAAACLGVTSGANAATSSGTLTVTGTVESSISLTIESAGGTTSGTGTAAATSDLGNISKFGSAPTGFTLARGASNWTLSSTVGVQVVKSNLTSTDYTLTAQLGSAPASGVA